MTCVVSHGRWPRLFCEDFFHRFSVSTVFSISLENRRLVIDRVRCTRKQRDTWVWFRGTLKMLHVLMEISRIDRALADWSTCSLNFSINFLYTTSPFPILYWYRSKTQCIIREKTIHLASSLRNTAARSSWSTAEVERSIRVPPHHPRTTSPAPISTTGALQPPDRPAVNAGLSLLSVH